MFTKHDIDDYFEPKTESSYNQYFNYKNVSVLKEEVREDELDVQLRLALLSSQHIAELSSS